MCAIAVCLISFQRIADYRPGNLLFDTIKDHISMLMLMLMLVFAQSAPIPEDCEEHWAAQRLDHFRLYVVWQ